MTHSLKILPACYEAIKSGRKKFEVRFNDRGFRTWDYILLSEWDGEKYTGRKLLCLITYLLDDARFCLPGYVILSIKLC